MRRLPCPILWLERFSSGCAGFLLGVAGVSSSRPRRAADVPGSRRRDPSHPEDVNRHTSSKIALVLAALLAGPALGADEVRFNTNFEGGSLGTIERVGDGQYRLHVRGQQDEHGRNRQASWYFFRLDGVAGRELVLTLTDFVGEYNLRPGACPMGPDIIPVVSHDGENWRDAPDVSWDDRAKEATLRLRPEGDSLWVAHQAPYTPRRLAALLEEVARCPDARVEAIGRTAQGRDLHLVTITDASVPDADKATVWLQARQHAWESGTSFVMEGALRHAAADRDLRRRAVLKFTPMVDPDGCAGGQVRFNANGFDVNRHWDEVGPRRPELLRLMPEIGHVKSAIFRHLDSGGRIDLLVNLHNTETAEYFQTMADDARSRAILNRLSDGLKDRAGLRPSRGPEFGAPRDGTANVLHAERGVLVALLEQRIARDPRTGRTPTPEERQQFGRELLRLMVESARP